MSVILSLLLVSFGAVAQKSISTQELFHVKASNVYWSAQVSDTEDMCVINAGSIAIMNASFPKENNIHRQVSFKLRNENGEGRTVNGVIAGVADYNGQQLYTAELEIGFNNGVAWDYRTVQCILADLSASESMLIIGRNWLGVDYIVK